MTAATRLPLGEIRSDHESWNMYERIFSIITRTQERTIDATVRLLLQKGVYADTAQLREGIEALGPDVYGELGYYERWAASAARKSGFGSSACRRSRRRRA